jgi:hypothetical protein
MRYSPIHQIAKPDAEHEEYYGEEIGQGILSTFSKIYFPPLSLRFGLPTIRAKMNRRYQVLSRHPGLPLSW